MRTYVLPYNMASESGLSVARRFHAKRLRRENSQYVWRNGDFIINWGCGTRPERIPEHANVLNPFHKVNVAINKIKALKCLYENNVSVPCFFTDKGRALAYLASSRNRSLVVRSSVTGSGGEGISFFTTQDFDDGKSLPEAPLYTAYIPKKQEFRVHIVREMGVVDVTRKALRKDLNITPDQVDWRIRNHSNGFVFVRDVEKYGEGGLRQNMPGCVLREALRAGLALGLDFCAVDVIYNGRQNKAYVLEVNTSPGMEETTAYNVCRAIGQSYNLSYE